MVKDQTLYGTFWKIIAFMFPHRPPWLYLRKAHHFLQLIGPKTPISTGYDCLPVLHFRVRSFLPTSHQQSHRIGKLEFKYSTPMMVCIIGYCFRLTAERAITWQFATLPGNYYSLKWLLLRATRTLPGESSSSACLYESVELQVDLQRHNISPHRTLSRL